MNASWPSTSSPNKSINYLKKFGISNTMKSIQSQSTPKTHSNSNQTQNNSLYNQAASHQQQKAFNLYQKATTTKPITRDEVTVTLSTKPKLYNYPWQIRDQTKTKINRIVENMQDKSSNDININTPINNKHLSYLAWKEKQLKRYRFLKNFKFSPIPKRREDNCMKIQNWWRRKIHPKIVERKKAIVIQKIFRGYASRNNFHDLIYLTMLLQRFCDKINHACTSCVRDTYYPRPMFRKREKMEEVFKIKPRQYLRRWRNVYEHYIRVSKQIKKLVWIREGNHNSNIWVLLAFNWWRGHNYYYRKDNQKNKEMFQQKEQLFGLSRWVSCWDTLCKHEAHDATIGPIKEHLALKQRNTLLSKTVNKFFNKGEKRNCRMYFMRWYQQYHAMKIEEMNSCYLQSKWKKIISSNETMSKRNSFNKWRNCAYNDWNSKVRHYNKTTIIPVFIKHIAKYCQKKTVRDLIKPWCTRQRFEKEMIKYLSRNDMKHFFKKWKATTDYITLSNAINRKLTSIISSNHRVYSVYSLWKYFYIWSRNVSFPDAMLSNAQKYNNLWTAINNEIQSSTLTDVKAEFMNRLKHYTHPSKMDKIFSSWAKRISNRVRNLNIKHYFARWRQYNTTTNFSDLRSSLLKVNVKYFDKLNNKDTWSEKNSLWYYFLKWNNYTWYEKIKAERVKSRYSKVVKDTIKRQWDSRKKYFEIWKEMCLGYNWRYWYGYSYNDILRNKQLFKAKGLLLKNIYLRQYWNKLKQECKAEILRDRRNKQWLKCVKKKDNNETVYTWRQSLTKYKDNTRKLENKEWQGKWLRIVLAHEDRKKNSKILRNAFNQWMDSMSIGKIDKEYFTKNFTCWTNIISAINRFQFRMFMQQMGTCNREYLLRKWLANNNKWSTIKARRRRHYFNKWKEISNVINDNRKMCKEWFNTYHRFKPWVKAENKKVSDELCNVFNRLWEHKRSNRDIICNYIKNVLKVKEQVNAMKRNLKLRLWIKAMIDKDTQLLKQALAQWSGNCKLEKLNEKASVIQTYYTTKANKIKSKKELARVIKETLVKKLDNTFKTVTRKIKNYPLVFCHDTVQERYQHYKRVLRPLFEKYGHPWMIHFIRWRNIDKIDALKKQIMYYSWKYKDNNENVWRLKYNQWKNKCFKERLHARASRIQGWWRKNYQIRRTKHKEDLLRLIVEKNEMKNTKKSLKTYFDKLKKSVNESISKENKNIKNNNLKQGILKLEQSVSQAVKKQCLERIQEHNWTVKWKQLLNDRCFKLHLKWGDKLRYYFNVYRRNVKQKIVAENGKIISDYIYIRLRHVNAVRHWKRLRSHLESTKEKADRSNCTKAWISSLVRERNSKMRSKRLLDIILNSLHANKADVFNKLRTWNNEFEYKFQRGLSWDQCKYPLIKTMHFTSKQNTSNKPFNAIIRRNQAWIPAFVQYLNKIKKKLLLAAFDNISYKFRMKQFCVLYKRASKTIQKPYKSKLLNGLRQKIGWLTFSYFIQLHLTKKICHTVKECKRMTDLFYLLKLTLMHKKVGKVFFIRRTLKTWRKYVQIIRLKNWQLNELEKNFTETYERWADDLFGNGEEDPGIQTQVQNFFEKVITPNQTNKSVIKSKEDN